MHNAAQLSRVEAQALVTNATARVCMRMEFDASGAPLFRDSQAASRVFTPASESRFKRLSRWAVTAAAGVLAACHGSLSSSVTSDPSTPSAGQPPSKMGKVCSTTLIGDVAEPVPPVPVRLGEVMMDPEIAPVARPDEH